MAMPPQLAARFAPKAAKKKALPPALAAAAARKLGAKKDNDADDAKALPPWLQGGK